jgi:hypothetical protein
VISSRGKEKGEASCPWATPQPATPGYLESLTKA